MELLDIEKIASYASIGRGIQYYKDGYVYDVRQLDDNVYSAKVKGSNNNFYNVTLNTNKLKSSTCDCPYCNGHQLRICKHKVALYFTIFPDKYEFIMNRDDEYEKLCEQKIDEYYKKIKNVKIDATKTAKKKIEKLSPETIKKRLLNYMIEEEMDIKELELRNEYKEYLDNEGW